MHGDARQRVERPCRYRATTGSGHCCPGGCHFNPFAATAGIIPPNQNAKLTATLSGVSQAVIISSGSGSSGVQSWYPDQRDEHHLHRDTEQYGAGGRDNRVSIQQQYKAIDTGQCVGAGGLFSGYFPRESWQFNQQPDNCDHRVHQFQFRNRFWHPAGTLIPECNPIRCALGRLRGWRKATRLLGSAEAHQANGKSAHRLRD